MKFSFIVIFSLISGFAIASTPLETMDDVSAFYTSGKLNGMTNFTPSNIETTQDLNTIFYSLKNTNKWTAKPNTQCFNRAHYWAKYMKDYFSVDSMKVHVFFTNRYMREVSKKWWFHVAPMVELNNKLMVLDNTFFKRPVSLKDWEKRFTRKMYRRGVPADYRCRVIENVSDYHDEKNQENEYCNILVSSMFYWGPVEIEQMEKSGVLASEFKAGEVKTAVANIFWVWGSYFNALKF